jgi:hypothetical protein
MLWTATARRATPGDSTVIIGSVTAGHHAAIGGESPLNYGL